MPTPLSWTNHGGRYETAQVGHLYCYIEQIEAYKEPGHVDYEPERFEWFIAPDDEDKNYRRAIAGSDRDRLATREAAMAAVDGALQRLAWEILKVYGIEKPVSPST